MKRIKTWLQGDRGSYGDMPPIRTQNRQTQNPYFPFSKRNADLQMLQQYVQQLSFSWLHAATLLTQHALYFRHQNDDGGSLGTQSGMLDFTKG